MWTKEVEATVLQLSHVRPRIMPVIGLRSNEKHLRPSRDNWHLRDYYYTDIASHKMQIIYWFIIRTETNVVRAEWST